MITREELITSEEYILGEIQLNLFNEIANYLDENEMSRKQFGEQLGVSKGYISQLLNGDFNGRISKLVELSLAVGKIPVVTFWSREAYIRHDAIKTEQNRKMRNLINAVAENPPLAQFPKESVKVPNPSMMIENHFPIRYPVKPDFYHA